MSAMSADEPTAVAAASEPTAAAASTCAFPAICEEARATHFCSSTGGVTEQRAEPTAGASLADVGERRILPEIMRLRNEQKALQEQRKQIQKELKNAEKRRQRLKRRARQLTDEDLLAVFQLRKQERDARTETAGGAAASSGSRVEE